MEWMQGPWFVMLLGMLATAGACALVYGGNALYRHLRQRNGYWREDEIEAVLLPVLAQAITAVYELSEHALEHFERALTAADKREIARLIYSLLDDEIGIPGLPFRFPLKKLVTEEMWCGFVQRQFDRMIGWYRRAKEGLLGELKPAV